jgi:hypothetical protein
MSYPFEQIVRRIEEYQPELVRAEVLSRVKTARLAFADYELLRDDFPQLAPLAEKTIDEWLLTNAAFISGPQAMQAKVNSEIETDFEYAIGFRPAAYGRAAIFSPKLDLAHECANLTNAAGCLDVKGLGVAPGRTPLERGHGTGLLYLWLAFREVIIEQMLRRVFDHADVCILTARNYAVIDLGFDARYSRITPAGLLVRQAYQRDHELKKAGSVEDQLELKVELVLRRYGISARIPNWVSVSRDSGGHVKTSYGMPSAPMNQLQLEQLHSITGFINKDLIIHGINIQFTREISLQPLAGRLIDFGGFGIYRKFDGAFATLVADRPLYLGQIILPSDVAFIQPDPAIRIPIEMEELNHQCKRIAQGFRNAVLSADRVREDIHRLVELGTSHLGSQRLFPAGEQPQ